MLALALIIMLAASAAAQSTTSDSPTSGVSPTSAAVSNTSASAATLTPESPSVRPYPVTTETVIGFSGWDALSYVTTRTLSPAPSRPILETRTYTRTLSGNDATGGGVTFTTTLTYTYSNGVKVESTPTLVGQGNGGGGGNRTMRVHPGVIAACIIGGVLAIGLITWLCRRNERREREREHVEGWVQEDTGQVPALPPQRWSESTLASRESKEPVRV